MIQLKLIVSCLLIWLLATVFAEEAYFEFKYPPMPETFIFKLTDDDRIAEARKILSGEEKERVHVHGRIIKRPVPYNPRWSYHLDPSTINFFHMAIEVCDAHIQYVEDHLDEAGGAFLPGGHYCPWNSILTREVKYFDDTFVYNKVYNVHQFFLEHEQQKASCH
ncbi:unnamed protein product [Cunninghamella blakesleeana]